MGNTHPLYESPKREQNEKKYRILSGNQCICCMQPMKEGETLQVHMNINWVCVHNSITEEECKQKTGAESQGCFPIGNSCAKKMPKDFIIK